MSNYSDVNVWLNKTSGSKLLARGSFVVAESVKVNFAYVEGKNGPFVSLPQDKVEKDGETKYYPHAMFISKDAVAEVNELVKTKYNEVKGFTSQDNTSTQDAPSDDDLPF